MHFSTHGLELFMAMPTDSLLEIEPAVSLLDADMMSISSLVCIVGCGARDYSYKVPA